MAGTIPRPLRRTHRGARGGWLLITGGSLAVVARQARRRTPLCLLMIDLDHFKRLNDTYGQAAETLRCATSPVTVSIGLAALPAHAVTGEELMAAADAALYEAKRAGRTRSGRSRTPTPASRTAPSRPTGSGSAPASIGDRRRHGTMESADGCA